MSRSFMGGHPMPEKTQEGRSFGADDVDISVILACYSEERMPSIRAALTSIRKQSLEPRKVIVAVDNNESLARHLTDEFDWLTVVLHEGARGSSPARNRAMEAVDTRFMAMLDDDEVADPDWLLELARPLVDPDVVGTGGRYDPAWSSAKPRWFPDEFAWAVGGSYLGMPTEVSEVRNVWSGNMAVRTAAFRNAGGFRGEFSRRGARVRGPDDTELCIRIAAVNGGRWVYVPTAVIKHEVPADRAALRFFVLRCYLEGCSKALMRKVLGGAASTIKLERDYIRTTAKTAVRRVFSPDSGESLRGLAMLLGIASSGLGYLRTRAEQLWARTIVSAGPRVDAVVLSLDTTVVCGTTRGNPGALSCGGENPSAMPAVSVIIAAYADDRWHDTLEAITSAVRQSYSPLEVILVIDHNPALAERARTELDGVTVLENTCQKGASGARNTGVEHSRGEVVVFLDDDAVATPDWLRSLCRHFSEAEVFGVGGGLTLAWREARPRWCPHEFDWVLGGSYKGMPEVAAPMRNVWSGNMAIRRSVFDGVGGFRPGFGKLGRVSRPEDTDLCLRVLKTLPSGYWMYDPSAQVAHKVPVERSTLVFFLRRCWNEGRGKGALARLMGANASTSLERRYTTRVLPGAFLRELYLGILRRDVASLERGGTILIGLTLAIAGFLTEMLVGSRHSNPLSSSETPKLVTAEGAGGGFFPPTCVADWDVVDPVPALPMAEQQDRGSSRVHLLVRLGTEPLGCTDFEIENADCFAGRAASAAWRSFGSELNARLTASGLPLVSELPVDGLNLDPNRLNFVAERQRLLETAPPISVIVCTRNRPERLAECIHGLAHLEYPRYEIVIVDNAPADPGAVPAVLETLELPVPVRYSLEPQAGLSRARNTGWRTAEAEIVAFIDDDEVPDRYWLAEVDRGFSATPEVGCVTGMVLPAELRTKPQQWFEQFGGHGTGRGFKREIFEPGDPQSPLYPLPPFGTGANMAFRRDVLVDIDGFHVALGAGTPAKASEDTFAFTRTLLAQHTMVFQPTALTWHYHRETLVDLEQQLRAIGTGTVAYYAALISYEPRLVFSLSRLIPSAINDFYRRESVRNATMHDFPDSLLRTELKGMLEGVPAYVRSVRARR
ncbi:MULTISPECIES: glycosyltransferase [unclassified Mycobacterium]|uniref:glycosyltransferase n=1 Tax=unclassified Mycobacterium TaxID=2642494 RepID=UPI0029C71142|nr:MULTISPECIES: glycosyltransferase [unclassified Mycobacterium]